MTITATDVNNLRTLTGAGMMDCKKALTEAEGDVEKAIEILRKKGQKVSAARQDKDAAEGAVFARVQPDGAVGVIFEMNCETDFVAKNDDFMNIGNAIAVAATQHLPETLDDLLGVDVDGKSVRDLLLELIGKIQEKIEIRRYQVLQGDAVAAYIHPGAKLGVLVAFTGVAGVNIEAIGKDVSMQIAAMNPLTVNRDQVDQDTINKEIEIGKDMARQEGKAEAMLEKIAVGRLNKFYEQSVLEEQEFVKDPTKKVQQYLKEQNPNLKVVAFCRMRIGG